MLNYLCSIVYIPVFIGILFSFHLLLIAAHAVSQSFFRRTYDAMCWTHLAALRFVCGTTFSVRGTSRLPNTYEPIIFVSNHQSMYDIPLITWHLRTFRPRFVTKKELGRWIPSISFPLRNLDHVLIDRADRKQAVSAIREFGKTLPQKGISACIFPEGTRSRDGVMKPFKSAGLMALLESAPEVKVVPLFIDGSWQLTRSQLFPIPRGVHVTFEVLDPLNFSPDADRKAFVNAVEEAIRDAASASHSP